MLEHFLPIVLGFILDLIIGDPHKLPHPICFIGNLIAFLQKNLRKAFPKTKRGEVVAGGVMWVLVCIICVVIPFVILYVCGRINVVLKIVVMTVMCYQILAVKSLKDESMKVYDKLENDTIESARYQVSMIVGRDTSSLDKAGVTKATVETIAENTSDGVVAPLIFMAIGGPCLGFLYKAINTMDSMVGYKNDKYINFGKIPAKMDDVANFVPARLSAIFMILASGVLKLDMKSAYKIYKRDRKNHASPNSAQTESVCAGALNVQLAGDAFYFGKLYKKKTIGDNNREITPNDIIKTSKLLYATSTITLVVIVLVWLVLEIIL